MSCDITECPREESNLRTRFRKPLLYPLSYEGEADRYRPSLAAWSLAEREVKPQPKLERDVLPCAT